MGFLFKSGETYESILISLSRQYLFKFIKGCLPQNLLSPLLNSLSRNLSDLTQANAQNYNSKNRLPNFIPQVSFYAP